MFFDFAHLGKLPADPIREHGLKQSAREVDSKRIEVVQLATGSTKARRQFVFELRSKCWYLASYSSLTP